VAARVAPAATAVAPAATVDPAQAPRRARSRAATRLLRECWASGSRRPAPPRRARSSAPL
jgi:hypothetical protein